MGQPKPPRLRLPNRGLLLCHRLGLALRSLLARLGRNLGAAAASTAAGLRLGLLGGWGRLQHERRWRWRDSGDAGEANVYGHNIGFNCKSS